MVKAEQKAHSLEDGSIEGDKWLKTLDDIYPTKEKKLIADAYSLAKLSCETLTTPLGQDCLKHGLAIAERLVILNVDAETLAAALLLSSVQYTDLNTETISEHINHRVAKLLAGVEQMDSLRALQGHIQQHQGNKHQIENLRKMLVAIVQDVRVVLIKIADQLSTLKYALKIKHEDTKTIAEETLHIYAPLANRLGIGQIKWELEDLAFRGTEGETYKQLAKQLDQRRVDREKFVEDIEEQLNSAARKANIQHFEISGRAKHIYSIYRKMQRKQVDIKEIYDSIAVRILVPEIDDCYMMLGYVHNIWKQIPIEFDDYINQPKENGYRSLHTAVIAENEKHFEVQIRTFDMHEEAELGVAAHWAYKEGGRVQQRMDKFAWLRQVLQWQKDLSKDKTAINELQQQLIEERIYVFTPQNEIIDLPQGATALDFAYNIHTEVGHRCRGAKADGKIIPLTYALKTGQKVEVLTGKEASPSRDWMSLKHGYLKTSRARAKVHHWFKQLDHDRNAEIGEDLLNKELHRLNISITHLEKILARFNFKSENDLYAAIGSGDVKLMSLVNTFQALQSPDKTSERRIPIHAEKTTTKPSNIHIRGVGKLLTNIAQCCKPLPGDSIIGYITIGRGVTVHRKDCINMLSLDANHQGRLIDVDWGIEPDQTYTVDIIIDAFDRSGLVHDISSVLTTDKISIIALNTRTNYEKQSATIMLSISVESLEQLEFVLTRLRQIPNVTTIQRKA